MTASKCGNGGTNNNNNTNDFNPFDDGCHNCNHAAIFNDTAIFNVPNSECVANFITLYAIRPGFAYFFISIIRQGIGDWSAVSLVGFSFSPPLL